MLFSSTIFLFVFLPVVLLAYYIVNPKFRNILLLISSLLFYAYGEPKFVVIMITSIVINYIMGLLIDKTKDKNLILRKTVFILALVANIGLLIYFKYYDFLIMNTNSLFNTDFNIKNIILPIGISFFTFQGMSYIIDLYNGKYKVQKNLINLALYISLFPQLIAGPIIRYIDVDEQITKRKHTLNKFTDGTRRFIYGISKKVIISNTFALIADQAFNNFDNEMILSWIGIISYTIQIYFDFSGYSDMAIGLGKMFGFDFLENFNYPYISKSITDFWRRWHISLSSWFKDYIYIPLGGNRRGNVYFNLLVVFMVTGLWHGASWNFVLWGLWHGLFLILEKLFKKKKIALPGIIKWFYTMSVVLVGWILFRSQNLTFALDYVKALFNFNNLNPSINTLIFIKESIVIFIIAIICATPLYKISIDKLRTNEWFKYIENCILLVLFIVSISFIITSQYNPFIYFNF